ncbi:MAG TPA: sugar phosphate nucleotidyltransferase [Candidatus Dormibacteraeota bacterium]|nr:sugar phosphate nucleotidyltransferase [Candidatus Dormibacteraeota bacterium]
MKAVVLAGGEGTRLRPLTFTRPKPMLPLGPNPVIHYVISHLAKSGFSDIIMIPGYLKDQVIGYVQDGSKLGVRVSYVVEPEGVTFGTAGSLKLAAHLLDDTFLVVQADVVSEIPLAEMQQFHSTHRGEVSIALTTVEDPSLYGVAVLGDEKEIVKFVEKPSPGTTSSRLASTGFYILEPEVVDYIENEKWDFAKDLFPYLMKLCQKINGFVSNAFWVDVGELKGYLTGVNWVLRNLSQDLPSDAKMIGNPSEPVFAQGNVSVGKNARILPPAWVENGTSLGDDVEVSSGTVLKEESRLMAGTRFDAGITFEKVVIGRNCSMKSTIIGERAVVGDNVTTDRAIIGQGCRIGNRAKILPGSKLWPNTNIDEGATVDGVVAVPRDKSFYFDTGLGQYSGILASSIEEFLAGLRIVPLESLEYHIARRDFEKWTKDVLGSILLADNIRTLRRSQLKGEELRRQLVDVVEEWAKRVSSPEPLSKVQDEAQQRVDPV